MTLEISYFWHFYSVTTEDNKEDFDDLDPIEELDKEYFRILKKLNCHAPVKGEGNFKQYFRYQQRSIVFLITQIEQHLRARDILEKEKTFILEKLLVLCEKLIDELLKSHVDYFDFSGLISDGRKKKLFIVTSELREELENRNKNSVDPASLMSAFINAIGSPKSNFEDYTYQIDFQDFFRKNIEMLNEHSGLKHLLMIAGFNHPEFMMLILQELKMEIVGERSAAGQYTKIISMIKEIKQLPFTGISLFDKRARKMKSQITKYLSSELKFLKELDFINSELVNMDILDAKYKVSLSVKQLAFYVFLNVECGIITEQRAKKIHEYVISHVATSEKADISEKSLKNAYYVHAPEDIRKIMEKLGKMLALAQSLY